MKVHKLWTHERYASLGWSKSKDARQREFYEDLITRTEDPSLLDQWRVLRTHINNPLLEIPDFLWWGSYLCCSQDTYAKVGDALKDDVRPCPIQIEGITADSVLLYPTNILDVARDEDIRRRYTELGSYRPTHYLFHWRFQRPQMFACKAHFPRQLFCVTGFADSTGDFYTAYQQLGLTGIEFKCVADRDAT